MRDEKFGLRLDVVVDEQSWGLSLRTKDLAQGGDGVMTSRLAVIDGEEVEIPNQLHYADASERVRLTVDLADDPSATPELQDPIPSDVDVAAVRHRLACMYWDSYNSAVQAGEDDKTLRGRLYTAWRGAFQLSPSESPPRKLRAAIESFGAERFLVAAVTGIGQVRSRHADDYLTSLCKLDEQDWEPFSDLELPGVITKSDAVDTNASHLDVAKALRVALHSIFDEVTPASFVFHATRAVQAEPENGHYSLFGGIVRAAKDESGQFSREPIAKALVDSVLNGEGMGNLLYRIFRNLPLRQAKKIPVCLFACAKNPDDNPELSEAADFALELANEDLEICFRKKLYGW